MDNRRRAARIAGLWYLLMAVSGPVAILYAPSQVLVPGDAVATAARVVEQEGLLRFGVVSGLVCQVSFVFLVQTFENLFDGVNARHTKLMVALVTAAVPIAVLTELLPLAAIALLHPGPQTLALSLASRGELAAEALALHEQGVVVGDTALALLVPETRRVMSGLLALPMAVGELSMVGWLLIRGVR